jgi:AcrR family transcriptional regulator
MATRHRTSSEDLGPAILAAAETLLEELGPDALSIRRIAERAGVAPMGIYTRFDGKHGVVDALFQDGFALLATTMRATASVADPVAAFREAGRAYRELALAHPARYRLMFLQVIQGYEPTARALEIAHGAFEALVDAARRGVESGRWRPADPAEVAQQVWATCHGWVALELGGINFAADLAAGYDELLDLVLRGLAPSDDPMSSGHLPSRSGVSSIEV